MLPLWIAEAMPAGGGLLRQLPNLRGGCETTTTDPAVAAESVLEVAKSSYPASCRSNPTPPKGSVGYGFGEAKR